MSVPVEMKSSIHGLGNQGALLRFTANVFGRDFIVGDLHGHRDELDLQLAEVGFDSSRDRLFSVGDLVDRGPRSMDCLNLIDEHWFHAVRGNHEQDIVDYASSRDLEFLAKLRRDGSAWIDPYLDQIDVLAHRMDDLPFMIEIETPKGLIGIIHADLPVGKQWSDLCRCVDAGECDPSDFETMIRSRTVIREVRQMREEGYEDGIIGQLCSVDGLCRLYSGHTSVETPVRAGNRVWIDTGIGWLESGRLTVEQIA